MKQLSPRAYRLIMTLSQEEGHKSGSDCLYPEHVLLALLKSADGLGYTVLQSLKINVLTYQLELEQTLSVRVTEQNLGDLPLSRRFNTLMDIAILESNALQNNYIGTEHLILAAAREELSVSSRFFEKAHVSLDDIRKATKEIQTKMQSSNFSSNVARSVANSVFQSLFSNASDKFIAMNASSSDSNNSTNQTQQVPFLQEFCRDLTAMAAEERLDTVVGRDKEIERVIQILSRRTKNNPVLTGEPGVGKTAIVEGLAQHIAKGNVPENLLKKRILSLDLAALVAGTKYRGEFEERMKRLMKEVVESKNIILFIDELHTLIGAGGPKGTMEASNMMKPALSRGEIQLIGATTVDEYRKYIEKDSALERRFQMVKVGEPSVSDTIKILEGIAKKYESFHGVVYDSEVIPTIVKFANRYIPERFLPDKAIDILDEAGAAKKIEEKERPVELAELEKSINELSAEKNRLVMEQDYEKAAMIRDKVKNLKEKLEVFRKYWKENTLSLKRVTEKDICKVISNMTDIPMTQFDQTESQRLLKMEKELHKSIIGQNEAIRLISSAVRRNRAGVSSTKRPIGSFIFLGPVGVGKTHVAKTLAKFLFGSEDALIRIDMSDFMEKHNSSRLVGAPPGYIGYEEGGLLTEQVRQHPYSIVLLDEIEKAQPDIFNLLLQLLEEGELSDNLGHTVNFRNTIVIMTSNAGAKEITGENKVGFGTTSNAQLSYSDVKSSAISELKKIMSPEFLNRIDDVIVFNSLSREDLSQILDIQMDELKNRLAEKKYNLTLTDAAHNFLVETGYDSALGARPLRRLIQNEIEDQLSLAILEGKISSGDTVVVEKKSHNLLTHHTPKSSSIDKNSQESNLTQDVASSPNLTIKIRKKKKAKNELLNIDLATSPKIAKKDAVIQNV